MIVEHETCLEYFRRRLSEGWKCIILEGHNAVLLSPDGNILRPVDLRNDVLTLRPNGVGDLTELTPLGGTNWASVYDPTPDEDASYVYGTGEIDLYALPNHTTESGVINFVKIYVRAKYITAGKNGTARPYYKTEGVAGWKDSHDMTNEYVTYSSTWTTNPEVGGAWTWEQIDALQAGVRLYATGEGGRCTQVYVEVEEEPAGLESISANMAAKMMEARVL